MCTDAHAQRLMMVLVGRINMLIKWVIAVDVTEHECDVVNVDHTDNLQSDGLGLRKIIITECKWYIKIY